MAQDHSNSYIPGWWLVGYFVVITLIFFFLFMIVNEAPPGNVPRRAPTYLNLLVADTYLTQKQLGEVLKTAKDTGSSIRSILVNDYKIADKTINAYSAAIANKDASLQKLLLEEFKKVTEEIKLRLGNIDTWFHYKFVLLGGVFLILIGRLEKAIKSTYPLRLETQAPVEGEQISEEHQLQGVLNSQAAHCVLGLGCVVAVTVDMHIRHELDAIMTLGNWVAYFAEPALSGIDFQEQNQGQFLFWENFLRAKDGIKITLHGTPLHSMPHLFFLTWVLYVLYVWTFQKIVCARFLQKAVMVTFWIVNVTFLAFGFSASRPPEEFALSLALIFEPLLWALTLVAVNFVCWKLLQKKICTARNPNHPSDSEPNSRSQATDETANLPKEEFRRGQYLRARS